MLELFNICTDISKTLYNRLNPIEYDGDRSTEAIVEFIDTYGMSNDKKIAREELPVQQANNNKDFTHIVEEL